MQKYEQKHSYRRKGLEIHTVEGKIGEKPHETSSYTHFAGCDSSGSRHR